MVRLILNKIDNPKQHLEVKINLHETQTTDKWISLLKKALMSNAPIKKQETQRKSGNPPKIGRPGSHPTNEKKGPSEIPI